MLPKNSLLFYSFITVVCFFCFVVVVEKRGATMGNLLTRDEIGFGAALRSGRRENTNRKCSTNGMLRPGINPGHIFPGGAKPRFDSAPPLDSSPSTPTPGVLKHGRVPPPSAFPLMPATGRRAETRPPPSGSLDAVGRSSTEDTPAEMIAGPWSRIFS